MLLSLAANPPHVPRRTVNEREPGTVGSSRGGVNGRMRCALRRGLGGTLLGLGLLLWMGPGSPALAVLIATGTPNGSAPPDDPGWAHVGTRTGFNGEFPLNGLTLLYLGNGWVMTANHVGEADLRLGGVTYPRVVGSKVRFVNEDASLADLMVFRILGNPGLPDLPIVEIASLSPSIGTQVTLIGRGRNRGNPTTWLEPPAGPLREGFEWASGASIRWGTNRLEDPAMHPATLTDSFVTDFSLPTDPDFTSEEAQAVIGDSGGAVFVKVGPSWELAGVVHSSSIYAQQPAATSLDGNLSYAADLARFRDQIIPIVRPECSDEIDNDGDGLVDYPDDPGCASSASLNEAAALPALGAPALALLALALGMTGALRSRRIATEARSL